MNGDFLTFIGRSLLKLRYRVQIDGLESILARGRQGILLLPNHPAYVDPVLLVTHLFPALHPHILADKDNMTKPLVRWLVNRMGIKPIPDPAQHGNGAQAEIAQVIANCSQDLQAGANYILYPAGRIYLSRFEDLGGNSAVETVLANTPQARVVLVRTTGLWGSSFSKAVDRHPDWSKGFLRGARALLANLIFFGPRRDVRIELVEPDDFPRQAGRLVMNRYLENFYNQNAPAARYVPYTFWERTPAHDLPEPQQQKLEGNLQEIPASIREQLHGKLTELAGTSAALEDNALLSRDLGLDSLARMELLLWIEKEFGHPVPDPDVLQTVGDCLLAACGMAAGNSRAPLKAPPAGWFHSGLPTQIPAGDTLTEVFLGQFARGPQRPAVADPISGMKTYRDLLTAILVLRPHLAALPGERIGIMLPASVAAVVAYLALLFAGKVPVMINWTSGSRNIAHGLELLGVERVLTAGQLIAKVESMGTDLSAVRDRFCLLEELGKTLGRGAKLRAFLQARLGWHNLRQVQVPETAVIIFTSGSENHPKAVPLSHRNLLANVRDLAELFPLQADDRMLGFLPPFHSFGLTGTMILPLCGGFPVVYFANPTDGAALARLVEAYRVSMLVGTPTFLSGIVRAATNAQLASLRMAVAGAEKCPNNLYDTLERRWPSLRVLEGYGISECSPVISVNRFASPQRGTIGLPLPSVSTLLVDLDTGQPVPAGQDGMLLVRGPSIFAGYLHYDGPSPFVDYAGHSWYRTGDLVRANPDGSLVFTGRLKRFIKLGGEMISLPAIEDILLREFSDPQDSEIPLAVEATASEEQPELVLFSLHPISREAANACLARNGLSPLHFIRQVRQIEQIPVLGTGKTDYRTLKSMLA